MAYNTPGEVLTGIANSIRTLYGSVSSIPFVDMPNLIKDAVGEPVDMSDYDGTSWILPFMKHIDFTGITDINSMFSYIDSDVTTPTHSLDLTNLSTTGLTTFEAVFTYSKLTEILGIENWDTSSVTDMRDMFHSTYISDVLDLSKWDVSNVIFWGSYDAYRYRQPFQSARIADLNLSGWNFTTSPRYFFAGAHIQKADLSNWTIDTGDYSFIFYGANIDVLDLTGWDTSEATSMRYMFAYDVNYTTSIGKMWVPSSFVYRGDPTYGNPFSSGYLVIYTDASSAAEQGWGTIGQHVVIHYNSTYQDFINA